MTPKITVDARDVMARFSPAGIPESVRNNLRQVLPDLTRRLGAAVEQKLDSGLKSHDRLEVQNTINEDTQKIVGKVQTVWTGDSSKNFIPKILETGAKAHWIYPRYAKALRFFWDRVGATVMFKRVWHPGFSGIHYTQEAFQEMEDEIFDSLTAAVRKGMSGR